MERRSKYILLGMLLGLVFIAIGAYLHQADSQKKTATVKKPPTVQTDHHPASPVKAERFSLNQAQEQDARDALRVDSLRRGYVPTQEVGEVGSREGRLEMDTKYEASKYERLEESPLLYFTDQMVQVTPYEDGRLIVAEKEALALQGKNLPECTLAMSVSMRIQRGKVTGCRLTEIPVDTLFYRMGMRSGDIVVSVNESVPDIEQACLDFVLLALKSGSADIAYERGDKNYRVILRPSE